MKCLIDRRTKLPIPDGYERLINLVIKYTLEESGYGQACRGYIATVSFVDDIEIRDLNKHFRNIDKETDVLSFPIADLKSEDCDYDGERELGDIIVSASRVYSQAEEYGHSPDRELGFLVAHGMLHLLGFDHETPEDEYVMRTLQTKVMSMCGL